MYRSPLQITTVTFTLIYVRSGLQPIATSENRLKSCLHLFYHVSNLSLSMLYHTKSFAYRKQTALWTTLLRVHYQSRIARIDKTGACAVEQSNGFILAA